MGKSKTNVEQLNTLAADLAEIKVDLAAATGAPFSNPVIFLDGCSFSIN